MVLNDGAGVSDLQQMNIFNTCARKKNPKYLHIEIEYYKEVWNKKKD